MILAMTAPLRRPEMSRDAFLPWAETQRLRYEFDGFAPVAMPGGTRNHSRIQQNILAALRARLRGGPCEALGPDAGIATLGDAVRYPDALVTCTPGPGSDRLIPGARIVFEVLSPSSGRIDRIVKLREYRAVASILRYVMVEHAFVGLTVFARKEGGAEWTATALAAGDMLMLPEIGAEVAVAELYEGTDLPAAESETREAGADPVSG